jgi:hypothetical protein
VNKARIITAKRERAKSEATKSFKRISELAQNPPRKSPTRGKNMIEFAKSSLFISSVDFPSLKIVRNSIALLRL